MSFSPEPVGVTQAQRVLKAARSFQGTCQADWLADVTPDGGPRITRVAARLHELDGQGYGFERLGWRNKTRVFRLCSEPGVESDSGPAPSPAAPPEFPRSVPAVALSAEQPSLFTPEPRTSSIYDPRAA